MVGHILKIKTNIPPLGTNILNRPSILELLDKDLTVADGFTRQLTLVSAPAGFGKTTLTRNWLAGREDRSAWYSLDEGDNEPERFWAYLISALQTLEEDLGRGLLEMLRSQTLFSDSSTAGEALLTPLLNDLFALEAPLFLVLDDYHLINNPRIHQDMIFLVENLPPSLHLAITTRSDPPWPLSKWRAKGKMAEIRLRDLKFSEEEAGHLLANLKGIQLSEYQLQTLYHKTEGWVTGLQLAAFSLCSSGNNDVFIENFAGSHRHVLHFLSEEVLARQPASVQDFLLQTSVLHRFCAPLCNALTGRNDSNAVLANLELDNLFVIPLDEQGLWYRYHQLFADLLLYHLRQNTPEKVDVLHARACKWFLKAGEPGEAVRHALSGNNPDEVGRILHEHYEKILHSQGPGTFKQIMETLPQHLLQEYPRLIVHKALFCLIYKGKEEARECIELAEALNYENENEQKEFAGMLAAVKSYYHVYCHEFPQALDNAARALQLLPPDNYYWRMNVAIYSGDARLFSGNPKEAYPFYLEAHWNSQKTGNHNLILTTGFKVATSLDYLGRLSEAEVFTQNILRNARDKGFSRVPRVGLLWALLGELLREKGNLEEAERCVERGLFFSEPENPSLGWNSLFKAALLYSQCAYGKALETIKNIEILNLEARLPDFINFPATIWEARILLKRGEAFRAGDLLSKAGVLEGNVIQDGQEWGYLVRSRFLMEGKNKDLIQARKLLDQIEELATRGEQKKLLVETLLVKACLEEKEGFPEAAENCLREGLQVGLEAGYVQVFLDEGKALVSVFSRVMGNVNKNVSPLEGGALVDYARKLYGSLSPMQQFTLGEQGPGNKVGKQPETSPTQDLIEELSRRELEVLGLISEGLSNEAVSKKLFLSLGTVKWHTTNIYGKLGVRRRTEAVAVARKLNLIT